MRAKLFRSTAVALTTAAALALAALPAIAATGGVGAQPKAHRVVVPLGHSIQAAIDQSPPGTVIVLEPGVYKESIQIRKDGITLLGAGASEDGTVLVPPDKLPQNLCRQITHGSGVCVIATHLKHGKIVKTADGDVVSGILFQGWPSFGVFAYGTTALRITNNEADGSGEYGFARFNSSGGLIENNVAMDDGEAGIYVGDSPNANVVVRGNTVSGNLFGFFFRHARHAEFAFNNASGNCQGLIALDDGEKGGVGDVSIHDNVFHANNLSCPDDPTLQGGGILLLGATNSTVSHNTVLGNQGGEVNSGGILLLSSKPFGGNYDPSNDAILRNTAYSNQPADIIWDGSGTGNTFVGNHCGLSQPGGIC